ncbi:MAG: glycoside hydrolase family protein [Opitutaceae bacterium]|nr:glycoside hydrolase family protein [Opitutaceae bacterium]
MPDHWVWCPSVIQAGDGAWAMFASRWPKTFPFHPGWLLASEVVLAISSTPEGPYRFHSVVLPARGAEYWDGKVTHNPRILRLPGNAGYALYYTGMTHPLPDIAPGERLDFSDPRVVSARASKRVGVAFSKSVYGPWERLDHPVLPTCPETFYSFLTSNPAPCVTPGGDVTLIFKSRAYEGNVHGRMMLGVARAPVGNLRSPHLVVGRMELAGKQGEGEVEDPFLWHNGSCFELVAKDMTGSLCGEYHAGVHAVSRDCLDWKLAPHVKAWSRRVRRDDGCLDTFGSVERPFVLLDEHRRLTHLFAAVADGPGGFRQITRAWNICIPLD